MKRIALVTALLSLALLIPSRAFADFTAFLGVNPTPVNRPVRGFSGGAGLPHRRLRVRVCEHERGRGAVGAEAADLHVQRPRADAGSHRRHAVLRYRRRRRRYRERLFDFTETHVGYNIGGGIKMSLAGPLRLRFDYRVFTLKGEPRHTNPQRFYVGIESEVLNVGFQRNESDAMRANAVSEPREPPSRSALRRPRRSGASGSPRVPACAEGYGEVSP